MDVPRSLLAWPSLDAEGLREMVHETVEALGLPSQPPWMRNEAHAFVLMIDESFRARAHVRELPMMLRENIAQFAANMCNTKKQLKRMGFRDRSVVLH